MKITELYSRSIAKNHTTNLLLLQCNIFERKIPEKLLVLCTEHPNIQNQPRIQGSMRFMTPRLARLARVK